MSRLAAPLRGQVFHVSLPSGRRHYWVVVSNNSRNAHLNDVLATMITTTPPRSPRPSYVALSRELDHLDGWVKCDNIGPIEKDQLGAVQGGLSRPTMRLVDIGLAYALSLPRVV